MTPNNQKTSSKWQVKKLSEVSIKIVGGGTPSRKEKAYWGGDIFWATVKDMNKSSLFLDSSQEKITFLGLKNSSSNLIPSENIITSTRMGVGRFYINRVNMAINQDLKGLIVDKRITNLKYLLWFLLYKAPTLEQKGTGTTVKGIRLEELNNLEINLPSIKTQQKITTILSSIDEAIQKTDQVIEKTEKLKRGLMNELLTKGIGHTKFKKTKIGEIPEKWQLCKFLDIAELQRGFDLPTQNRTKGIHPLISSNGKTDFIDKYKVIAPGVVTGRSGTTGNVFYVSDNFWPLNTTLYVKNFNGNYPKYIYYLLKQIDIKKFLTGTGVPTLNRNIIHEINIAIPISTTEQKQTSDVLDSIQEKINTEITLKQSLLTLKNGLMSDIFSQKVEVN